MAGGFRVADSGYPYFITCTIVRWLPVFLSYPHFNILTDSIRHCQAQRGLRLHAYVFMPTHIHMIASTEAEDGLSAIVRDFKRFTAKEIYAQCEADNNRLNCYIFEKAVPPDSSSKHKVWQDEFHPEQVQHQDFFTQKVNYLHVNPVRKGFVTDPQSWYYSSATDFLGVGTGPLELEWIEW